MAYPTFDKYKWANAISSITNTTSAAINSTTSTLVLAANTSRLIAGIYNATGNVVYLGLGVEAKKSVGVRLEANAKWETKYGELYQGAVNAISATAAAGQKLTIIEGIE